MLRWTRRRASVARLDRLEAEAVYILRELAGFARPALLFSGGKDSAVLLHLALKALCAAKAAVQVAAYRYGSQLSRSDRLSRSARKADGLCKLIVRQVEESIQRGSVSLAPGASRNAAQAVTLLEAQQEFEIRRAHRRRPPRRGAGAGKGAGVFPSRCVRRLASASPAARALEVCLTAMSASASICGCFRRRIGPKRTCGATSPRSVSSCRPSILRMSATSCGVTGCCFRSRG